MRIKDPASRWRATIFLNKCVKSVDSSLDKLSEKNLLGIPEKPFKLVGIIGLEPTTSSMSTRRSNQLSYIPTEPRNYSAKSNALQRLFARHQNPTPAHNARLPIGRREHLASRPATLLLTLNATGKNHETQVLKACGCASLVQLNGFALTTV